MDEEQKYYVTIVRNPGAIGQKTGLLLGPYDTLSEAEGHVEDGRRLAEEVDPFYRFDSFGVTGYRLRPGQSSWLPGKLNDRLAQ